MSRKSLPLGVMAMILIVALATIGVAYGLWSETLTITGTVHTGELDIEYSGPWVYEFVNILKDGKWYADWEPPEKDRYAECDAWIGKLDGHEELFVNVTGAYPSYKCLVWFDIHNAGTVPVHLSKPVGQAPAWVQVHTCYPDWVQIHQSDRVWGYIFIHFTNEDKVGENEQYTFHYDIEARQWNEAPAPGMSLMSESCTLTDVPGDFVPPNK